MTILRNYPGLGAILAVLALWVSALNPLGFMLQQGEDGFAIELCTGAGLTAVAITPAHSEYERLAQLYSADTDDPKEPTHEGAPPCEFASAAGVTIESLPSADFAVSLPVATPITGHRNIVRARHASLRPPATGPPLLI